MAAYDSFVNRSTNKQKAMWKVIKKHISDILASNR